MTRLRISIAALMGLVLFVGVGFAALKNPTIVWASALFTLVVTLLAVATVGGLVRQGRSRAAFIGAAVFGWSYVGIAFGLGSSGNGATPPPFLTKALMDSQRRVQERNSPPGLFGEEDPFGEDVPEIPTKMRVSQVVFEKPSGPARESLAANPPDSPSPIVGPPLNWLNHRRVGHSLGAILFGLVGAAVGRALAARDGCPEQPRG
jgi:hypothetical protein